MTQFQDVFSPPLPAVAERTFWGRLPGSSRALCIASAARKADAPLLVLTADTLSATRLEAEIQFYLSSEKDYPVMHFPGWETLPYDHFSPYQDIISERLSILASLMTLPLGVLIVPVTTIMHRLAPTDYVRAHSLLLKIGDTLDRSCFRQQLEQSGYLCVSRVLEHGEFAVRGSLLDIFPMGSDQPYRIDLFDDEIESIRLFDPETQRTVSTVDEIELLPAREFPLTETGIRQFRSSWREKFEGLASESSLYRDVTEGLAPAGIEYYLPLFFEQSSSLFDYLPSSTVIIIDSGVEAAADVFWQEIKERYEQLSHDVERPLLVPADIFLQTHEVFSAAKQYAQVQLPSLMDDIPSSAADFTCQLPKKLPIEARAEEPLALVKRFIDDFTVQAPGKILFVAESNGRRETLIDLFNQHGIKLKLFDDWSSFIVSDSSLALTVGELDEGVIIEHSKLAIVAESELFGARARQDRRRRRTQRDSENVIKNLTELNVGAPVVHEDHGVGRYLGLVSLDISDIENEYLQLEYAGGDKLYVPVASLQLISRYTGIDPDRAPLHKLGSGQWQKARAKAAERARDVAAELLDIYAKRAARHGHVFEMDNSAYQSFSQSFPFEETPDQEEAIQAVLDDMCSPRVMDRLVCGDVGFGKTEVAMRAAFVAVNAGKQVAMLVPTTLLSQQHYQNFKDRFADWPIRVEQISRFRNRSEQAEILKGLESGSVDIIIGTHKLLQEGINFKRLGLLIIDEEHRFGVRQKERIKQIRSEVDILTLTATPIPRTLNMALSGTRELSIIATAPSRRLAVKTFVREWKDSLLQEALLRELSRGGQIYVLHNEIETIEKMATDIQRLVPAARVQFAHGRMRERELEQVMLDFYHHRFNILVCTTIIETGIDVPSANTIIINRADKFGLAQLYQLRGRVGRSHHRAYAYLLVPDRKLLSDDARRRLEAIESLEELGAGFTLATHDLEIRGAGEILGSEQSGQIQEIGFGMYTDLLARAVKALKSGQQPDLDRPLDHGAEIDLHIPALIPDIYLPDVHTRLITYKRIASAADDVELTDLQEEMVDRFGQLPDAAKNLFRITFYKLRANQLGIRKIDIGEGGGRCTFVDKPSIDPMSIIKLIQTQPQSYRLEKNEKLRILDVFPEAEDRFQALEELFGELTTKEAA